MKPFFRQIYAGSFFYMIYILYLKDFFLLYILSAEDNNYHKYLVNVPAFILIYHQRFVSSIVLSLQYYILITLILR